MNEETRVLTRLLCWVSGHRIYPLMQPNGWLCLRCGKRTYWRHGGAR